MIYRFRVILDTEEDVFRDLEIDQNETLEVFHIIALLKLLVLRVMKWLLFI